jgi:hypothetical protein
MLPRPLLNLLNLLVILLVVLAGVLASNLVQPGSILPAPTATPTAISLLDATPRPRATPTLTPPCNWAALIQDANATDNTVSAGQTFTQRWQVKNIGTCTWNADYDLFFVIGKNMGSPAQKLGREVAPGQTIDIAIELIAPETAGSYIATYKLRSDDGVEFGLDFDYDQPLWAAVTVSE